MKTLLVDNYDSFTFNLYQMIAEVNGEEPIVIHNDQLAWTEVDESVYDNIVISPGPGRPERTDDFGLSRDAIEHARIPLLGICLGHQGIGHVCGGRVVHAPTVMHGRRSSVFHSGAPLFRDIPQGVAVVRYHSLMLEEPLPPELERLAWTADGVLMGLRHRQRPLWGVQFHPESICTELGDQLLKNFRDLSAAHAASSGRPRVGGRGARQPQSVIPKGTRRERTSSALTLHTRQLAHMPDPEQVFVQLYGAARYAFWLDNAAQATGAERFSFMGAADGPHARALRYAATSGELEIRRTGEPTGTGTGTGTGERVERRTQSIFDYLHRELDEMYVSSPELPFDFNSGFVGYFGYELKQECTGVRGHDSPHPDAQFLFADRFIVFDHVENTGFLVCLAHAREAEAARAWLDATERALGELGPVAPPQPCGGPRPVRFGLRRPPEDYCDDIRACLREIHEGETYEVCLTNMLSAELALDPLDFYRGLRRSNPAPKAMYLRFGDMAVASSSPESFLRITADGWVESKPIKGTLPRGSTPEDDAMLRTQLRESEKNRSENLMIVDLLRNDLGIVCDIGTVSVPGLMLVESYRSVHQLVSTIRGHLREDMRAIDCVRATFPGGSMTGAPKVRTMHIIDDLERGARGVYSGSAGYLALGGAADLNIVIRTAVIESERVSIGVGGAIVALSDPEEEMGETVIKGDALMRAVAVAAHGSEGALDFAVDGVGGPRDLSWPVRKQATPVRAEPEPATEPATEGDGATTQKAASI